MLIGKNAYILHLFLQKLAGIGKKMQLLLKNFIKYLHIKKKSCNFAQNFENR